MLSNIFKRKKIGTGKRVFVGLSGGVDSSVSAALLVEQGYTVIGVFIRTWQPEWIECTWRDDRRDAMRICAHLNIPFLELDLEKEYKQGVADYMIAEYKRGRTPNPDVMCNREVKFGGFLSWALTQGADYVATGHYAKTDNQNNLLKGVDPSKDQSYFLWTLTKDQVSKILFPIGDKIKSEVRILAEKFNLPTATKKDSQGVCFIGEIDMKDFLGHYISKEDGDVVNESSEVIGAHQGVLFYTLGERHGFTIHQKTTQDKPYYVIGKNIESNQLIVSQNPELSAKENKIIIDECVWRKKIESKEYTAQIRYHGDFKKCLLEKIENSEKYLVMFELPDFSISSGQSIVIYDEDICIGGGIVA